MAAEVFEGHCTDLPRQKREVGSGSVALNLICDTVGSGLPVLVLHGLFGSSGNWRGVARELAAMHTVISVDLRNRGESAHFAASIRAVRRRSPGTRVEVLIPDFRGRADVALEILCADAPDVMSHNLETVPRLYRPARPGADYEHSLRLLQSFWERRPDVRTKSGLMLGLGETDDEVLDVMRDLRRHEAIAAQARAMGFAHAACGPPVRSSSHADRQAVAASI